jgi:prepilin-type N-terminal cleavage/methylation domain-containing protein
MKIPEKSRERVVKGFTFIELVIVTAILPIVSLALYATFNNGIKIWQKVNSQIPEEDLDIFFEKFTVNLKDSFKFTGIYFIGREDMFQFPTLVNSSNLNKRTVGQVMYLYDQDSGILTRQKRDFSEIYMGQGGTTTDVIRNIKFLRFQYYFYDEGSQGYLWVDEWEDATPPLAVSIELEFKDEISGDKFIRTVSIPTAG